ncbi:MAG: radical SAM protein [Armatimonadetes bacterium CG07_land_8_20_14_0_80_40_9]|nr:MAG: radical SAM protein [Armatimonadetes bacterium CG07_land_8_20_14_0_80_40_9]
MKAKYLFGPVPSRRLGSSLGIDPIPHKTCTYNCIYCQCGRTTNQTIKRKEYISSKEIIKEVKEFLTNNKVHLDYITFSGSGEPTLNSKIGVMIREIKKMTSIPIAVLTNSSLLSREDVKEDLLDADLIVPSLDAVVQQTFEFVNRPQKSLNIGEIVQGLIDFRKKYKGKIYLEILLCRGVNDNPPDLKQMKKTLNKIRPDKIQLNTVVRPPAEDFVFPLNNSQMQEVQKFFGGNAEIVPSFKSKKTRAWSKDIEEAIINLLKRRSCTISDLSKTLGINQNEVLKYTTQMEKEKRLGYKIHNQKLYYTCINQ